MGPLKHAWALAALVVVGCGKSSSTSGSTAGADSGVVLAPPGASPADVAAQQVCINEFMASNEVALVAPDGASPDWIEVHNPSERDVSLQGWSVIHETDGTVAPLDHLEVLAAGAFLVLYADGSAQGDEHLPFTLEKDGGAVFLARPDGGGDRIAYGQMQTDVAVFRSTDCCASDDPGCWDSVFGGTPGASNSSR